MEQKKNYRDYYPFDSESHERRRSLRCLFKPDCTLRVRSCEHDIAAQMQNISLGGMQVSVELPVGAIPFYVVAEIPTPLNGKICLEGYVDSEPEQSAGKYAYRIKFFNLTAEQQLAIHELLVRAPRLSDRRERQRVGNAVDINSVDYRHIVHKSRMLSYSDRRKGDRRRINQAVAGERRVQDRRVKNRRSMEEKIQYVDWVIKSKLKSSVEKLLQFYKKTDFIYKKKLDFLLPIKDEVVDTIDKMLHCNDAACKYFFVMDGDDIQGSTMAVQYTDDTWIVQHTSTLPTHKILARELLAEVLGWVMRNADTEYFMTYFQEKTKFAYNKFTHFVDAVHSENAVIETHEYVCKPLSDIKPEIEQPNSFTVDFMCDEDYPRVYGELSKREKQGFIHSIGLKERPADFKRVKENFARIGLKRDRKYLVAKDGDTIIGFAFVDISSYGINLSLLFNIFTIFVFDDQRTDAVYVAMVNKINRILLEHGKYYSIALIRRSARDVFEKLGYQYYRTYVRFVCARKEDLFDKAHHVLLAGRKGPDQTHE